MSGMYRKPRKLTSNTINVAYEKMNPVQRKYFRKITMSKKGSPEKAFKLLGVKRARPPTQITKKQYVKLRKYN